MSEKQLYYHYSKLESVVEIARSKILWFSDSLVSNDRDEYENSMKILENVCSKMDSKNDREIMNKQLLNIKKLYNEGMLPYIICFSNSSTIKSQWDLYADGSAGAAIGFDLNKECELKEICCIDLNNIKKTIDRLNEELPKVIRVDIVYNKAKKEKIVREVYSTWKSNAKKITEIDEQDNLLRYLLICLVAFKEESFEKECETRLVSFSHPTSFFSKEVPKNATINRHSGAESCHLEFKFECMERIILGSKYNGGCKTELEDIGIKIERATV